jgi:hypothetical protein
MDSIDVLPTMSIVKSEDNLVKGKKYAYASNGYVLGEYYGSKNILNGCIEKCTCELDAKRIIYAFQKGNRGAEMFEVGLVEIENGSIPETRRKVATK